jgi:Family of unknown function (DUF5985)
VWILLNAVAATASLFAGVLFLRFWRETVDRLFGWFAIAFWMFTINFLLLALVNTTDETRFYAFLPRLAGFLMILAAIVDRNRR